MKLHRLTLENFKGVASRTVTFPDRGVIVLEGANEVGKTSMIEAFDLLLTEKDRSRKASVRAVQPVGMDVGSAVEAEVSTGGYRLRYRKQWMKRPATELEILQPRHEQLVGDAAHDRVLQILDETMDRSLWDALRFMQAAPLTQAEFGDSTVLAAALDGAAGQSQDAGTQGDSLVGAAEQEYLKYFTRTGRVSGEYRTATEALAAARDSVERARSDLDQVTEDVHGHTRVTAELTRSREQVAAGSDELTTLRAEWEAAQELQTRVDRADRAAEEARRDHERAGAACVERDTLVQELAERTAELDRRSAEAEELLASVEPLTAALQSGATARAGADAAEEHAATAAELARQDVAHLREQQEAAGISQRLERLEELAEGRATARAQLSRCRVDEESLARIERAEQTLEVALATQRAASAVLTLEALDGRQDVQVAGEDLSLTAGHAREQPLTDEVEIVVPGSLRLTFRPEAGAGDLADEVVRARRSQQDALRSVEVADLDEARARCEERRIAEAAVQRAEDQWTDQLGDDELSDLQHHQRLLTDSTESYRTAREADLPLPADVHAAEQTDAQTEAAHRVARDDARAAAARVTGITEELNRQRVEVARAQSALDSTQARLEVDKARLEVQREQAADADLGAVLEQAGRALEAAATDRDRVAAELDAVDPVSLRTRLDNAEQRVERFRSQQQSLRDQQVTIASRLELTGSQGRQESLDAALTALDAAERRHRAVEQRALAAQLLFRALEQRRDEAKRAYVEPFSREVAKLGRIVYGPDFRVTVGEDLHLESRTLGGDTIPFDQLSGGAREQLAVITRLAVASLVDAEQGVPVVIDDALGYSDPERLQRIGAVFAAPAENAQVILLTCTPERYSSIGAAEVIRLDREPVSAAPGVDAHQG